MKIVIDNREAKLKELLVSNENVMIKALEIGDVIILDDVGKELVILERKSVSDLISSIKDGRYKEQSHRLSSYDEVPNHNIVYIIEGRLPKAEMNLVLSAISSLFYYKGFSVLRTTSVEETSKVILNLFLKIQKESKNNKTAYTTTCTSVGPREGENVSYSTFVKKKKSDNITPSNFLEIVLCQIPGIGPTIACSISQNFSSIEGLLESLRNNKGYVSSLMSNNRKIGSKLEDKLHSFLITEA